MEEGKQSKLREKQESMRMSIMVQRQSIVQQPFVSSALHGLRESTVMQSQFQQRSKEEQALKQMSSDLEAKYIKQMQATAKSSKLTDSERKGMLMIAQQFERYKKAYEQVKREKETLEEE